MKYLVSIIIALLIFSCKTAKKEDNTTYFGGKIINPQSKYVLFLKNNDVKDTLFLDENNLFLGSFENLTEGLYSFIHGAEFQNIYLEPRDSLLVRLNTWDFDESLVFSGKGSVKNEFLIQIFLQNEKDKKKIFRSFKLNEQDFQQEIDKLHQKRSAIYDNLLISEQLVSSGFEEVAKTAMYFQLYQFKEVYPLYHRKSLKLNEFPTLSSNFYEFRQNINLNNEDLITFHPFQNYATNYVFNLGYQKKEENSDNDNLTMNVLNSIIENIELEELKNKLLKTVIVNDFMKSESSCSINEPALDVFLQNCTNEDYITHVKKLVNDSQFVVDNEPLEDFEVVSYTNDSTTMNKLIKDKNTVIYFWSSKLMPPQYLQSRIKYLETKHTNITFIGINLEPDTVDIFSDANLKLLDINRQFKLTDDSNAHRYLKSNSPRTIIVNKEGNVVNGFIYLDSKKLSKQLETLEIN